MSSNIEIAERAQRVMMPNYQPAPVALVKGEGCYVVDQDGRRYLDMVAGIAVSVLGHGHPRIVEALKSQAEALLHTSNLFLNAPSVALAERLVELSFADQVFFSNSGTESNEAAIKLARRYAYAKGEAERIEILSFKQGFHGRTLGALAATAQPKYHEGFGPMPAGFRYLEVGDEAGLKAAIGPQTAAIVVEVVQGEGGVRPVPEAFLKFCRAEADAAGALLMFDEVQTGIGRTGRLFAHEHSGVTPDIMTLAKGLGAGLPIGAVLARSEVAAAFTPGSHGNTFGGNPVAARLGLVVLDEVSKPERLAEVRRLGERLQSDLRAISARFDGVFSEVRGLGLLVGAELRADVELDAPTLVTRLREQGVLAHVAGPRVLRLLPPLIVTEADLDVLLEALQNALGL